MNDKVSIGLSAGDRSVESKSLRQVFESAAGVVRRGETLSSAKLVESLSRVREWFADNPIVRALVGETILCLQKAESIAVKPVLQRAFELCALLLKEDQPPGTLFWLLNDLRAVRDEKLLSEMVFAVPPNLSAATGDGLVSVFPLQAPATGEMSFAEVFEQQLQLLLEGSGDKPLHELASLCRTSIDAATHEYAAVYWLTCGCYLESLTQSQLLNSPAHRRVLQQVEIIVQQYVRAADTPILDTEGIALVENSLSNMLSYLACVQPAVPVFDQLEKRFRMQHSLALLSQNGSPGGDGDMLSAGAKRLVRKIARLKLDIDAAPESPHQSSGHLIEALQEIRDVSTVLFDHVMVLEIDQAAIGLKNYCDGDGALNDLEHCVALLIRLEDMVLERFGSQLSESSDQHESSDEGDLDGRIAVEMIAMLEPLEAETDSAQSDHEWLSVVLSDIASLSEFLAEPFLAQQLIRIKSKISGSQSDTALLQRIAQSVRSYLLAQRGDQPLDEARHALHIAIDQANTRQQRVQPAVSFATLASDNQDLLQPAPAEAGDTEVPEEMPRELPVQAGAPLSSLEFGEKCNQYIDTIQLALDTALGSSGNLAPDKTVTNALENLHRVVSSEHDALLKLIEPLAQVLSSAEQSNSLLSQADTLLIQEAIVAITIGVDAVANEQVMPELVADVATRITELAVDDTHGARGGFESAGLVDIFVEEGEDIAQRLFELFQRWRAAPEGGSRIQGDIKRLLHTLKGSADTVGLSQVARLAHALETYLAGAQNPQANDAEFFEISTDAVEVIIDDIDRIRNREADADREELIALLSRSSGIDSNDSYSGPEDVAASRSNSIIESKDLESIDKTPAFGSTRYFNRLEKTQCRLSGQFWKARDLQASLRMQMTDMQSSLQSTAYLLEKSEKNGVSDHLSGNLSESLQDLKNLHTQVQRTLERLDSVGELQLAEVKELQAMVATTDQMSVEHLEIRSETLVQRLADTQQKTLRLQFSGSDLELNRKRFGDFYKPLEQLIINAAVHGIEDRESRTASGKNAIATISVSIAVTDNNVVAVVSDDGAGISFTRLRLSLQRRASYDPSVSDQDLLRSIVEQGVSASESVDRSAGRGVGLDIVKEWVMRKHGKLSVTTEASVGTTFTLTLPIAVEFASVMVVQQGADLFAVDVEQIAEIRERKESGVSLGALTGIDSNDQRATLCCITGRGKVDLNVDAVIGRKTIKFTNNSAFLSASDHYRGAGVIDNNQVVLRLNLDRLLDQQSGSQINTVEQADNVASQASVLIVDDSVTIRASFGRAMQSAGYRIVLARNGLEAMEYLETHQPEVIILDLEMPLMDGYELGAYIKNQPRLSRSALVIVSSKPRAVVGDWLTAVNADAYYEKPCSETAIAGLVAELL